MSAVVNILGLLDPNKHYAWFECLVRVIYPPQTIKGIDVNSGDKIHIYISFQAANDLFNWYAVNSTSIHPNGTFSFEFGLARFCLHFLIGYLDRHHIDIPLGVTSLVNKRGSALRGSFVSYRSSSILSPFSNTFMRPRSFCKICRTVTLKL